MTRKKLLILLLTVLGLLLALALAASLYSTNVTLKDEKQIILVRTVTGINEVIEANDIQFTSPTTWQIATALKRIDQVKPGRYVIKNGISNLEFIRILRSGGRSTLTVRIDDVETLEELAGRLGSVMLHDSAHFIQAFYNEALLKEINCGTYRAEVYIRPNTYDFYWDMEGTDFMKRMKSETDRYWNSSRIDQTKQLNLSVSEVTTLASIVKAETGQKSEAPIIAGLYLNRLRSGIPLQSDPTAIFGRKSNVRRVYLSDINADSPYNTYKIKGLPPGPINFPEDVYLEAVLNAAAHEYIYMCAEPGGTGKHRFSKSLGEHEKNRSEYIAWLNRKEIR
jgi:UPF0755 protein